MKSFIDTTKPMSGYLGTLGALMLLIVLASSVPELSFSAHFDFYGRRAWAVSLFLAGSAFSALAFWLHARRASEPWRVTRAHVTLPFMVGALALLAAVIISH